MKYTYQKTVTVTVTVKDIYGMDNPSVPDGWESTGEFRPPKKDDWFLTTHTPHSLQADPGWTDSDPRIILRKKKRKQIVLTEVGVGIPKKGQYWEDRLGNRVLYMAQEDVCGSWFDAATIYEREDKEV